MNRRFASGLESRSTCCWIWFLSTGSTPCWRVVARPHSRRWSGRDEGARGRQGGGREAVGAGTAGLGFRSGVAQANRATLSREIFTTPGCRSWCQGRLAQGKPPRPKMSRRWSTPAGRPGRDGSKQGEQQRMRIGTRRRDLAALINNPAVTAVARLPEKSNRRIRGRGRSKKLDEYSPFYYGRTGFHNQLGPNRSFLPAAFEIFAMEAMPLIHLRYEHETSRQHCHRCHSVCRTCGQPGQSRTIDGGHHARRLDSHRGRHELHGANDTSWVAGSLHSLDLPSPRTAPATASRFNFTAWTGGGAQSNAFTMPAAGHDQHGKFYDAIPAGHRRHTVGHGHGHQQPPDPESTMPGSWSPSPPGPTPVSG